MPRRFYPLSLLFLVTLISFACRTSKPGNANLPVKSGDTSLTAVRLTDLEKKIAHLQERYHIPGLSVGIVNEKKLVWAKGFGYADLEKKIVPDENTIYQIASVTKTFGSIILMQQVQAGKVSLDDPIGKYGINLGARWGSDPRIKVKHLLTHTAMGTMFNSYKPGYKFRYNGGWYQELGKVIEQSSGHTFGELLIQQILTPLALTHTAPSTDDSVNFALTGFDKTAFLQHTAKPYDWKNKQFQTVKFSYAFGPAAGIMSSVSDLAVYSTAIDEGRFLADSTWQKIFTPYVTPKGKKIQYGLGWYVKYYKGVKVIWHTGWWSGYSALLVKIPAKDLTFIVLANSQDLSRPFYHIVQPLPGIGMYNPFRRNLNNTLRGSDFGAAFLDHFLR
ncbi:serine hydrolase domain-containing protein [Chitinophaga arvensicola]|uniref:CubicO group peptidase, beta-lactamase class C family n=1 Tax=Chitinophaga arvensicola TaxID=29529 RepID=A0A1I0S897_9BACT|nr:serine hydrolase domain-containing protein [Chitinophaga arvensicola]SEW51988.1 CubicO group peptidase, beta-lactamase class C family [Chitinophaga arvensicola]